MRGLVVSSALFAALAPVSHAVSTLIPATSLNSQADFDADWDYLYPWGSDHNGAARMDKAHVTLSNGVVTLTAERVYGQPDAQHGGQNIQIKYLSGAIHAREHFSVSPGGGFDFNGEFIASTNKGTWPAFWLTYVDGWPPEIDMAEWKGSGKISFNTFNTSNSAMTKDVPYPNPQNWHSIRCETRDLNGRDVQVKFYMDGQLQDTQVGKDYVDKPMYLIMNLQMEGSSGSPGPDANTTFSGRNIEVLSYNP